MSIIPSSIKLERNTDSARDRFSTHLVVGHGKNKSHLGETSGETREGLIENSRDLSYTITGKGLRLEVVRNVVINLPQARRLVIRFPFGEGMNAVEKAAKRLPAFRAS